MLAFGTQVRGFKPGQSRQIFKGQIKIFSTPSFGGEVKPSVPCRRFAACKRSLNVTWKSTFRQMILAHAVPPFATRGSLGLHGRGGRTSNESGDVKKHLNKYEGSTISLHGCGASGAYALGPERRRRTAN